jgi:hypothetical protein
MNYKKNFLFSFKVEDCFLNIIKKVKHQFFLKEEDFRYIKTRHSFHLVDPSPWRAADRRDEPFSTQKTQLGSSKRLLGKHLARISYLYTDYYLGLACQYVLPSTAGHTGKRVKRTFKPVLSNTLEAFTAVQLFHMGVGLLFTGIRPLRILGTGIWYISRNFWVYMHVLRQITSTNIQYWKGNRGGSRKQFLRLGRTESMNQQT